jgi:type IX secretion system PorP/SprF family membrane protein
MKKLICIFVLILPGLIALSQQQPQYTQYMFNKTHINPAAAGSCNAICASGAARFQWIGFEDDSNRTINPRTYLFNFEMPLYSIKSGIGMSLEYDHLGFEKNLDIRLNYAFHQVIKEDHKLSYGISFEMLKKTIDFSQYNVFDEGDPLLESQVEESGMFADLGLGIYYRMKDKFYAGISVSRLLGSSKEIGDVEYNLEPHYYFMTGYDFTLKDDKKSNYVLSTGLLAKSSVAVTQLELHALLKYNQRYWGGVMYRLDDAVGIIAGLKFNDFSFGASYDITTSSLTKAGSKGSPEFFLKYCFPVSPKVQMRGYYNPRYL